jgi:site-specific DNA-methyltransferase (adenine-specific)
VGGTHAQYDTMSDGALAAMPVAGLGAEDCTLLLWTTMPKLLSAQRVMDAWGFEYHTVHTVWVKREKYLGRLHSTYGAYTRPNAELLLIGSRGTVPTKLLRSPTFRHVNVLLARPQEHSSKPAAVRAIAVELFGDMPRIELFGRKTVADWISWGNDVDGAHRVETEPESPRHAAEVAPRKYNMTRGAATNTIARRNATRASKSSRPTKLPTAALAYLERYEQHNCMAKSDYALLSDDDDQSSEHTRKRARFSDALDSDGGSLAVPQRELATLAVLDDPGARRSATYPELTERDVKRFSALIAAQQRRNADTLFEHNYNKHRLPARYPHEPQLDH